MSQRSGCQHWPFNARTVRPVTSIPDAPLHPRLSSSEGPEIYPPGLLTHICLWKGAGPGDSQLWGLQRHGPSFIDRFFQVKNLGNSHFAVLTLNVSWQLDGSSLRSFMDFMSLSPIWVCLSAPSLQPKLTKITYFQGLPPHIPVTSRQGW